MTRSVCSEANSVSDDEEGDDVDDQDAVALNLGERTVHQDAGREDDAGRENADADPVVAEASVEEQGQHDGHRTAYPQVAAFAPKLLRRPGLYGGAFRLFACIGHDAQLLAVGADEVTVLLRLEQHDGQHRDDGGNQEAPFEVLRIARLAEVAADKRSKERPHVDTHIEDGIGRVEPTVAGFVQLPDERRHRGLEESVAQYKEGESAVHQSPRQFLSIEHGGAEEHQKLPDGHQYGSPKDGATDTPILVGHVAADKRSQIDEARVAAVDGSSRLGVEQQGLGEKQDEDGAHAIIAEALGRTGGENQIEAFGMSVGCIHVWSLFLRREVTNYRANAFLFAFCIFQKDGMKRVCICEIESECLLL